MGWHVFLAKNRLADGEKQQHRWNTIFIQNISFTSAVSLTGFKIYNVFSLHSQLALLSPLKLGGDVDIVSPEPTSLPIYVETPSPTVRK